MAQLLAAVGNTAEFSTYTKHDITHIDSLLETADWLIPEETWGTLTVADALIITLSIYVHDLGMLVTKAEFDARSRSDFPTFRDGMLADDSARGIDLRDRLNAFEAEDQEHFLYEEFVRTHHAERIESWINNAGYERFGVATAAVSLIQEVLTSLDPVIKSDIALVARSHHLDDLDDRTKYRVGRSYGNDRQDEANLHYAALILRTADLVHITRDRTPTIQYLLGSPRDPLGQREWRKQRAIRAVKPKPEASGASTSIEVHARFDEPDGYFALMEYLDYCDSQLKKTHQWAEDANAHEERAKAYKFAWADIDRDQIETVNFVRKHFSFTFDREKVLELLTGHALYNDASVAIREITQNAIDAVRLQEEIQPGSLSSEPDVIIEYDPASRLLRVRDNGVGMTQDRLLNHFLKVGSSSYQSQEFREKHPGFASISRFGIGVLSAFMIADEIRVATVTTGEPVGRELVLKSVHGRYLIRDLAPNSEVATRLGTRGTEIELTLRASSEFEGSILKLLQRWIILPRCRVVCRLPKGEDITIGWESPRAALEGMLPPSLTGSREVRVVEKIVDNVSMAIAQVWNSFYKEWEILRTGRSRRYDSISEAEIAWTATEESGPIAGVSIQGIRVTETLPGWSDSPLALVDVSGAQAPRTNVARTDLEAGAQLDQVIETLYGRLVGTIEDQIPEVSARVSQRLALKEARYLFSQLASSERGRAYTRPRSMQKVLWRAPVHPVEQHSVLTARSAEELQRTGFSVLVGPAADDAARFMDWLPQPKGMMALLRDGGLLADVEENPLPLLGGQDALFGFDQLLWNSFEPATIRSLERGRSVLLDFRPSSGSWKNEPYTREFASTVNDFMETLERPRRGSRSHYGNRYCVDADIKIADLPLNADILFIGDQRLFGPNSMFSAIFRQIDQAEGSEATKGTAFAALYTIASQVQPSKVGRREGESEEFTIAMDSWLTASDQKDLIEQEALRHLLTLVHELPVWSTTTAWQRRGDG